MKLWEVIPKKEDYGEISRMVVIAENIEQVEEYVFQGGYFEYWQLPFTVNEIVMDKIKQVSFEGNDL